MKSDIYEKDCMKFSFSSSSSPSPLESELEDEEEEEEEEVVVATEDPPHTWTTTKNSTMIGTRKRLLSKQLSMKETTREVKWEQRRRQILQRRHIMMSKTKEEGEGEVEAIEKKRVRSLTDEDLDELRGSIELGFGFNEDDGGQDLRDTLPALDLYFAINRQFSDPKMRSSPTATSTPSATSSSSTLYGTPSPRSPIVQPHPPPPSPPKSSPGDTWKIFRPGDKPHHVKTRLRHWAQAVACSLRQCN